MQLVVGHTLRNTVSLRVPFCEQAHPLNSPFLGVKGGTNLLTASGRLPHLRHDPKLLSAVVNLTLHQGLRNTNKVIWGRGEKDKLNSCHPLAPHWDKSFNSLFCPRERSWEQRHFDGVEKVRSQVTLPVCHCAWLWSQSSPLPHQPWARITSASWRVKKDLLGTLRYPCG